MGACAFAASDLGLVAVEWADAQLHFDAYLNRLQRLIETDARKLKPYLKELAQYLEGKRLSFTIPIDWTLLRPFQRDALQAVFRIPYGETRTYAEIALEINRPTACRAVGRANATNPMPLVIPVIA